MSKDPCVYVSQVLLEVHNYVQVQDGMVQLAISLQDPHKR